MARNDFGYPFVGVDLTAGSRPSDVAAIDATGTSVAFHRCLTDDDLAAALHELGARVVAIDSPMGLPTGLCCLEETCPCTPTSPGTGRSAERALAARGIACFWTTKRTIIKTMVYRAIRLKTRLEAEGYTVLEVYPYAVKRLLLAGKLPRKNTPLGIACLMDGVRGLLPDCQWPSPWTPAHDNLDALYCAVTARLYELGETEALGDPAEVPLIVPRVRP